MTRKRERQVMSNPQITVGSSLFTIEQWRTLGSRPNWIQAGRIILQIDPTAKLDSMSLGDIADFFSTRAIAVPQGGDPTKAVTEEQIAMIKGAAN